MKIVKLVIMIFLAGIIIPSVSACMPAEPNIADLAQESPIILYDEISARIIPFGGRIQTLKPYDPVLTPGIFDCCSHCPATWPVPCTPGQTRCRECDVHFGGHADTCACLYTCNAAGTSWVFTRECTFAICKNPSSCQ